MMFLMRRLLALIVLVLVSACGGGGDEGSPTEVACGDLEGETLVDAASMLEVVRRLEGVDDLALSVEARKAAPAVEAGVRGEAPADIFERVESLRMMCAIARDAE